MLCYSEKCCMRPVSELPKLVEFTHANRNPTWLGVHNAGFTYVTALLTHSNCDHVTQEYEVASFAF